MIQHDVRYLRRRARYEVDDAGRQPCLFHDLQQEIVRVRRRARGLPDDRAPHDCGRRGEVAADRGEVERRDGVDEPRERPVLQRIPLAAGGQRLLALEPFSVVEIEPPEVDQLACRIDLRLVGRLRLAQHGSGVHGRAVPRRQEIGGLEEDGRAALQRPPRPIGPGGPRRRDRRLDLLRPRLMNLGEHVLVAMRHHGVDRLAGAHFLAADHERDLDLAPGEVA